MKKYIITLLLILLILTLSFVSAIQIDDDRWTWEEWNQANLWEWSGWSFLDDAKGMQEELFYPVSKSDIKICRNELSTDLETEPNVNYNDPNSYLFDTALSLQGNYEKNGYDNNILYEFSWFFQPKAKETEFTINYHTKKSDDIPESKDEWIELKKDKTNPATGKAGFDTLNTNLIIDKLSIKYSAHETIVPVIQKTTD